MRLFTLFNILLFVFSFKTFATTKEIDIAIRLRFDDTLKKQTRKRYETIKVSIDHMKHVKGHFSRIKHPIIDPYLRKHLSGQKKFYVLNIDRRYFLSIIFNTITDKYGEESLLFTDIVELKVYTRNNRWCHGHHIMYQRRDKSYRLAYMNNSFYLKEKLSSYNFGFILEGMISRSGRLGDDGIRQLISEFKAIDEPPPKSIASIHVMGFGGKGGNYNLLEMKECKKKNIDFLYSYHPDPKKTVYMDGTDPEHINHEDPNHGNIYDPETLAIYVSEKAQAKLKIAESLEVGRRVIGDTMDFLQTVENIIDADWPVHIHCKGGKHKTGMLGILFKFLAYSHSMAERYSRNISVFDLTKGILFKKFALRPAEVEYAEYNGNVYRHSNIVFMRRITSGEIFKNNPDLQKKWDIINEKFKRKVRNHIFSVKINIQNTE